MNIKITSNTVKAVGHYHSKIYMFNEENDDGKPITSCMATSGSQPFCFQGPFFQQHISLYYQLICSIAVP